MRSRISVNICVPLLWLCLLTVAADAQQGIEKPASYSNNIGTEISDLRNQAARGDAIANYQLGHLYMMSVPPAPPRSYVSEPSSMVR